MDDRLHDYRKVLVEADQRSQEQFDRTLIALSGGALGISMTFVDKFIGSRVVVDPLVLLLAWFMWTTSLIVILSSFYLSRRSVRSVIDQIDKGTLPAVGVGGRYARLTRVANMVAPLLFIAGTVLMGIFIVQNTGGVAKR